jgi:hypothetical protein
MSEGVTMRKKKAISAVGDTMEKSDSPVELPGAETKVSKTSAAKISKEQRIENARKAARSRWWKLK